jgi:hypothetical protein
MAATSMARVRPRQAWNSGVADARPGFKGHTPRQHRASSRKGGLARIAKRTRQEQRRDSAKGGEGNRQRWVKIRQEVRGGVRAE